MNDSCPMWRMYAACLLHMGHESFIYGTWLIHQCGHTTTHDTDNSTVGAFIPRVEWRGLRIRGGNFIPRKVVFCIFRWQSIWMRISGDTLSSKIFWRNYRFQNKVTWTILRKTHALLRIADAVSALHSTQWVCGSYMAHRLISSHRPQTHGSYSLWFIYGTQTHHTDHRLMVHIWCTDSFIHGTWLIHTCGHSITHDAGNSSVHTFMFVCGPWLVHTWDMTHWHVCPYQRRRCRQFHCPFIHIHMWDTWLMHTWDMTHSCVLTIHRANAGNSTVHSFMFVYGACLLHMGHESFIYGTWLIHQCAHAIMRDNGNSTVRAFMFAYVAWLVRIWLICIWDMTHSHVWGMTHSYMGHGSFIYGTWLIHMCGTWLIHMCGTWLIHMCGTWLIHMCAHSI